MPPAAPDDARYTVLLGNELDMLHLTFEHLPLGILGQAARACAHWRTEYWYVAPRDTTHRDDTGICTRAASLGAPVGTMEYLCAHWCPWGTDTVETAAAGGHLALVQYLLEVAGCPCQPVEMLTAAVAGGHLEVVRYLLGLETHPAGCVPAAVRAHLAKVPDQRRTRCLMASAALTGGHLEVLQCLFANGWPRWDFDTEIAAEAGQLQIVQWLHEDSAKCGHYRSQGHSRRSQGDILNAAAAGGNIEVVKYLRAEGYPWGARTVWRAASYGCLEMVKYLHANGCPWDPRAHEAAAKYGRNHELQAWMLENGGPIADDTNASD